MHQTEIYYEHDFTDSCHIDVMDILKMYISDLEGQNDKRRLKSWRKIYFSLCLIQTLQWN